MDFNLDAAQTAIRNAAASVFSETLVKHDRREVMSPDFDTKNWWQNLDATLGLCAGAIPEEYGGVGLGTIENALLLEQAGAALLPGPLLSTVGIAVPLVLTAATPHARQALLPRIATGAVLATVAVLEDNMPLSLQDLQTTARLVDGGYVLNGAKTLVLDAELAQTLLVVATTDHGVGIFLTHPNAVGVSLHPLDMLDSTRATYGVGLVDVPAQLVSELDSAAAIERAIDLSTMYLAAEQVGAAQACLDMTLVHVNMREQFSRPIGALQAIQHKCASMAIELEAARTAAYYAAWSADADPAQFPLDVSVAATVCWSTLDFIARNAIQIHGGIGFSWEHDAHLFLKRAMCDQYLLSRTRQHRDRIVDLACQ